MICRLAAGSLPAHHRRTRRKYVPVGSYAASMPRKSLQGRTCGVSCEGGRARALQRSRRYQRLGRSIASQ
ncbi:hypothetical protein XarbCFBP8149_11645 [Xanthomonas arboricola]|nr:hypothetical protein XarbCFBP8149_11645 [Xanthomonas arboricola]